MNGFVVLKFGGTSVATLAGWQVIAAAIGDRQAEGLRPVIVCSALAGVTDLLTTLLPAAAQGQAGPVLEAIEARHAALAAQMGVDFEPATEMGDLMRWAEGVALIGAFPLALEARVLAQGELMATRLGARWLTSTGVRATFIDAGDVLTSVAQAGRIGTMAAQITDESCKLLQNQFRGLTGAVITQGFIARDPDGRRVVLGRGGSDTSAALFAARLQAVRCEIWTDVPGIYTTNPRDVPDARLLTHLSYDEAQELATAGAKVLHPRCLAPVRRHGIALHVRCTHRPQLAGTAVGALESGPARVKAIAARRGVTLVSMDTLGMWQQVGFLADVFTSFQRHGVSVDLVSTSESNVTASFDPAAGEVDPDTIAGLLADLNTRCTARLIRGCAAVSLVGQGIRAIMHRLGPALALFEDRRIHLVCQAASDLNLTFVVDADDADRLVRDLHKLLFATTVETPDFGPTWRETFDDDAAAADGVKERPPEETPWWRERRDELLAVAQTPAYVYDTASIDAAAQRLRALTHVDRVFYAIKANDHPAILRQLHAAGLGLECVSPGELAHVFESCPALEPDQVLFTPNFAGRQAYADALALGVHVTVDNIHPLQSWPDLFAGASIFLRLDPGGGRGHHEKVRTAGNRSKFGIPPEQIDTAASLVKAAGATVVGLHAHRGSQVRDPEAWRETGAFLAEAATRFESVRFLDIGGGLGVRQVPGDPPLDLPALDAALGLVRASYPGFEWWIEPGRYLVAEAGVLIATVTQLKTKGARHFVGVDAGMHTLIRPALYGAWHGISNLSRIDDAACITADIVGPICESGDTLGRDRRLPETFEGDRLIITTAGAYGRTMSSGYNRRGAPLEVILAPLVG